MVKHLIAILLFYSLFIPAASQQDLKQQLETTANDTLRLKLLRDLSFIYSETNPDSSYYYGEQGAIISRKLDYKLSEAFAMQDMGYALVNRGNYPKALQVLLMAVQIAEDPRSEKNILPVKYQMTLGDNNALHDPRLLRFQTLSWLHFGLGVLYENAGDTKKGMLHYSASIKLAEQSGTMQLVKTSSMNLGRQFLSMKKLDSALIYAKKAYEISKQPGYQSYNGAVLLNLGRVYLAVGDQEQALDYIRQSIPANEQQKYFRGVIAANLLLSDISTQRSNVDSAFYFVEKALRLAEQLNSPDLLLRSYTALAGLYKSVHNNDSTVKYQGLIIKIKDSLFNSKQAQQFQNIDFDEQQRHQQIETAKKELRDKWRMYTLLAGLTIILLIAILLWRNSRQRKKANLLLSKQKTRLESTLLSLKETQKQLIQSEKMASLGELTAGIAHEIQNPLNFVNNFSDVNKELIDELKSELAVGNVQSAVEIAVNIRENEEKINHHGRRADSIVKGMLQHSRTSSGEKKPTDINALADEYLRLAYHGFRAKDKSFSAKLETNFDNSIGKINIATQDIGRVILNLINNAFYAVGERQKVEGMGYEPTVTVITKKINDNVEIMVKDNGIGIPQKIADKIFQPFFTTKPTGQGTGLGLSLSYDIIKAHGGEIKVASEEGKGSVFIVQLPVV